jgi:nuclear pore complex protein Nup155
MEISERIISVISDTGRDCFYTLTSKSSISIYKPNGDKAIQHVQTISNLYKAAQDKAPGFPVLTPQSFQVISLHVVDESESRSGVQLLAMTSNGVRLYFSPSNSFSYGYGSARSTTSALRSLQLVHVRLPPSNLRHPDEISSPYHPAVTAYGPSHAHAQPTVRSYVVASIENSCYSLGLTVAAQQGDTDGTDYILCMAPDLTRIGTFGQLNLPQQQQQSQQQQAGYLPSYGSPNTSRPPLTEYATLLAIPGRTWAMATVPRMPAISMQSGVPAPAATNELATQFSESPRQFMLLTNVGLTFLVKRRAMDYLKAVLEELQSEGNVQPIIEFRDR